MVKQLHTNQNLLIVLDLFQPHYQNFLIIYLKRIVKIVEIKTVDLSVSLKRLKNNKLSYNCKDCRKKQLKRINGLIKNFPNIYKFCNNDINKFILLLRKGGYPYEYMDSWEKFNETTLPNKKTFCSRLYLEDVTN